MYVAMYKELSLLMEKKRCIFLIISVRHGETIHPFLEYGSAAPSIRSLFLYKHYLFIGTKIHTKYGGVWLFDLKTRKLKRIKIAMNQMISALTLHNSYLVAASGSCKGVSEYFLL